MSKTLVLCDFDGTISETDITDALLDEFADSSWRRTGERYDKGELSHFQMNTYFAQSLRTTPEQLAMFIDSIKVIRSGFQEWVTALLAKNYKLVIISSGYDFYISRLLGYPAQVVTDEIALKQVDWSTQDIVIICNRLEYCGDSRWLMISGWAELSCQISSPCKGQVFDRMASQFQATWAIGNSSTDVCMAKKATTVFATGSLPEHCKKNMIQYQSFDKFSEITL